MTEFVADIQLVLAIVGGSLLLCAFIVAGVKLYFLWKRLPSMEKEIKEYCDEEGYEYSKQDGTIHIKRRGNIYRIFLHVEPKVNSTSVWFQYLSPSGEVFNNMHWVSQPVLVNYLSHQHPSLNVSIDMDDHILWVHYRADIRSKKEFAYHFNFAVDEIQALLNDCKDILPRLQEDFPLPEENKQSIGFA